MKLSSQEAFELSKNLRDLSVSIGNYRFDQWNQLKDEEKKILEDAELSLINASSGMTTLAVGLVLDETQLSYDKLQQITSDAKEAVERLKDISRAITIATAAVSLAGAVISGKPSAIVSTAEDLYNVLKKK